MVPGANSNYAIEKEALEQSWIGFHEQEQMEVRRALFMDYNTADVKKNFFFIKMKL